MATLTERIAAFRNPGAVPQGPADGKGVAARGPGSRAGLRPRGLAGARARLTQDTAAGGAFGALWGLAARPDREVDWRALNLDSQTLDRVATADLVQMMADLSPEVSGTLWHFVRFCNPGWEARATRPGTEEQDTAAQARLDEFLGRLGELYGAVDVVWNGMFMTAFLRGAMFVELVADKSGRRPVDLVVVDPHAAEFRERDDPARGRVWQLGQMDDGNRFIPLDVPTVSYVPVDPAPGGPPYGRSLVTPAIFSALFLLSLLHDLRRVVAQQGYPRLDLEVQLEQLQNSMPDEAAADPEQARLWVEAVITEIANMYGRLEPDDAYVHTDVVKVNRPVGAVDASSLGAVDSLIRAVERMAIRGLKTMPLLMGSNEAVSETHANRQWEIHVAGIKAVQHLAEQMIERLLTLALQMQGLRAMVTFRFAELRASEEFRDAQTMAARIANARDKYMLGWISQDEAALEIVGHAPDRPTPRYVDNVGGPDFIDLGVGESGTAGDGESTDGEARGRLAGWQARVLREMEAAREGLEKVLNG